MKKYFLIYPFILIGLFFQGCSEDQVSIHNKHWECNNSTNLCLVEFDVQRAKGVVPIEVEIRIRAHRTSASSTGSGNAIVANKKIRFQMASDENVHFSEKLAVSGRVTNVVISAWVSR
jgi:hypothetical protein